MENIDQTTIQQYVPSESQKTAREIMGKNYFGIEEAKTYFGVNPSQEQLAALSIVPFSEATLKECKYTHVLIAVFLLSMKGIQSKVKHRMRDMWYSWNNGEAFIEDRGVNVSWHLVHMNAVTYSTFKALSEQKAMLRKNEEVPTARVITYTIVGHYLATNERLFGGIYVFCSDRNSQGHIGIGYFDGFTIKIGYFRDDDRGEHFGLASQVKP